MQKHNSTLPPPSDPPTCTSVASHASQSDAPNLLQDQFIGSVHTGPAQPATFHSNPTPPIDSVLSPTDSSYQGYGHIPYEEFHPQPTPPSDTTPSPIEVSYPEYQHIPSGSFETLHPLPSYAPPPSNYSFYQGYSYGDLQPVFPPHAEPPPSQRSSTQSELDISLPAGDESEILPSFPDQIENCPPSIPSTASRKGTESKETAAPANLPPLGPARAADFHREYSTRHSIAFHHRASSPSLQDSDDEPSFVEQSESETANLSLARGAQYEIWRRGILVALDEASQYPSFNTHPLTGYLAQEFNTVEHADCRLQIFHEIRMFEVADFLLHSLLIDQIPLLKELRKSTITQENGIRLLRIRTRDRFITPLAIETTLQVCYGRSIMEYKGSSLDICSSKSSEEISTSWMGNALALAASGSLFQLESVVSRGLQIASSVLNWENIEKALSFAMDGGLHFEWDPDNAFRTATESFSFNFSDSTVTGVPPGSSEAVATGSNLQSGELSSHPHARSANDLLLRCLEFIISRFAESWELDVLARPLADIDRLPVTANSRSPVATSKFSQIQFGDHPSEKAKSCDENIMLSSLLLSLPFPLLNYILDRMDQTTRSRNINTIVDERERRRRQAVKCESISWSQRQEAADDWAQAGWKESVVLENSRLCLQRKWVGFGAPSNAQT